MANSPPRRRDSGDDYRSNRRRGDDQSEYSRRREKSRWDDNDNDDIDRQRAQRRRRSQSPRQQDADRHKRREAEDASPQWHHHHHQNKNQRRRPDDFEDERKQRWGKPEESMEDQQQNEEEKEHEPDFGLSGALAAETNTVNGVVLLHNEPPEARPPTTRWRLYVFKDNKPFGDPLHVHKQSRYMFGRERNVADIPTDHPSCSKQHAVIQFRATEKENPKDGMMVQAVRPYIMDLGSTNGTFLNGERIEAQLYYELLEKDMLKFGNSTREYVLLKEK